MKLPAIPEGPWTVFELQSVNMGGDAKPRVIVGFEAGVGISAGPGITEVPLANAIAAVPAMLKALASWNCGSCGGSGRYKDKGFRGEGTKRQWVEEEVACKVCGGHGVDLRAQEALRLAGATDDTQSAQSARVGGEVGPSPSPPLPTEGEEESGDFFARSRRSTVASREGSTDD